MAVPTLHIYNITQTSAYISITNNGSSATVLDLAVYDENDTAVYTNHFNNVSAGGSRATQLSGLTPGMRYEVYGAAGVFDSVTEYFFTKATSTNSISGAVSIAITNSATITGSVYVEESGPFPPRPPVDAKSRMMGEWGGSAWGDGAWGGLSIGTKQNVATIVGQVRIARQNTNAITGSVRIWKSADKSISGSVNVEKAFSKTITGAVNISAPSYDEITGCVTIYKRDEEVGYSDIAGRVRITKTYSKDIDGSTRIAKLNSKTISGAVRIIGGKTANISGLVRIVRYGSNTISGRVRIKVVVPEKLPEDWEYSGTTEPEEWEKVDKASTDWSEVEKSDESWSEVEKDTTSWTDSDVAGAEEWSYPLEDAG